MNTLLDLPKSSRVKCDKNRKGVYSMNSKFDSAFLSKLTINDDEVIYSEKGKSGRIPVSNIKGFEVTEGRFSKYGCLKITEKDSGTEHIIHFVMNHNKGIREWQTKLGFTNITEPKSIKEIEDDYRHPMEAGPTRIQIDHDKVVYKTLGKEGIINTSEIKEVIFKGSNGFLGLGSLVIKTAMETVEIKTPASFNKALSKWISDIKNGLYRLKTTLTSTTNISLMSNKEGNEIICSWYKVKGINPNTNRKKTITFVWDNMASQEEVGRKSGLLEPYEVEQLKADSPTLAQERYANGIGLRFPSDATTQDATIFLTRYENQEPIHQNGIAKWLLEIYIYKLQVYVPKYASVNEAHIYYYHGMPIKERVAYFAMRVYNDNKGKSHMFPHEATREEQEKFKIFSEEHYQDDKFMESFQRYGAMDLPIGGKVQKRLKAYDIANSYL